MNDRMTSPVRLLIVAEPAASSALAAAVGFYRPTLAVLESAPDQAPARLSESRADLVILDLDAAPDRVEVLRRLRAVTTAPLVAIHDAASAEEGQRALGVGADLVLARPLAARDLVAHIEPLLRLTRARAERTHEPLRLNGLRIDVERRRVAIAGREVQLTATEFALLHELAANAGRVMTREVLLTRLWGSEYRDEAHYLTVYIARLRAKIESDPRHPRLIVTVRGAGYELVVPSSAH